ncbi:hypothetical protein GCK72_010080 [Caenorhabditis remanei]|uniref:Uncharacterized protein n=1 Tax=Caenorhabditis remanei TaxID=31234 RepID=A0A6A5H5M6_CAERE|nr:hypothetical protein GCK72_010080 [Caenorhabditis remanei]KAF1761823.1 hypothetical protein GCK72_010080 [Caenorhabditis remanei]
MTGLSVAASVADFAGDRFDFAAVGSSAGIAGFVVALIGFHDVAATCRWRRSLDLYDFDYFDQRNFMKCLPPHQLERITHHVQKLNESGSSFLVQRSSDFESKLMGTVEKFELPYIEVVAVAAADMHRIPRRLHVDSRNTENTDQTIIHYLIFKK